MLRGRCTRSGTIIVHTQMILSFQRQVYTVCHSVCIFWTHYSMASHLVQILRWLQQIFWLSEFLGFFTVTYQWHWEEEFVCLCWGLTSQSTIFQSCRDGATASWVINQYFRGVKCLAQGHNTAAVGIEPPTSRSGVRHSTTEPPRSPERKRRQTETTTWRQWTRSNSIIWASSREKLSSGFVTR